MNEYKKFSEVKVGDILYLNEISLFSTKFQTMKVVNVEESKNKKEVFIYMNKSILPFSCIKDSSNWNYMIYTTKEEALKEAKNSIKNNIRKLDKQIRFFTEILNKDIKYE